jgi:hypothetical protein
LPQQSFEGLGFSADSFEMYAVTDDEVAGSLRKLMQFRNFTVLTPPAPNMTDATDTGQTNTDNITSNSTPVFTGTLTRVSGAATLPIENASVFLSVDGSPVGSAVNTDATGFYSITAPAIPAGSHNVTIRVGETSTTSDTLKSLASSSLSITIDTTAPRVENVAIGSTTADDTLHPDYSIPDGDGEQIRSVPVAAANQIKITFSDAMADAGAGILDEDSLVITRVSDDGADIAVDLFAWDSGSKTGTWRFDNDANTGTIPYVRGQYVLTLADDVQNVAGLALDGEWTNPTLLTDTGTSTFPSGNTTAGGDFEFYVTLLPGDVDRDNVVNTSDVAQLFGSYGLGSGQKWINGDMTGEGAVGLSDLIKVQNNLGADYTAWPGGMMMMSGGGGGELDGGGASFSEMVLDNLSTKHGLAAEAVDEIMTWLETLE